MLSCPESQIPLKTRQTQETLISILKSGETCLAGIEMLVHIPSRDWHFELTNELCSTLTTFAKKKSEIIICPAPLLFCVLVVELLTRLAAVSLQYQNKYLATAENYKEFGMKIEDAIKDETELKYFAEQQDYQSRSVLTILSKNKFYYLLEDDDIGTIVAKMWVGTKKNYGILGASTIYNSFNSPSNSEEAMQFSKRMDSEKPFMFQYDEWIESGSLRFMAQAATTLFHVFIYQMVVYSAIAADTFADLAANSETLFYLRISQLWVVGIMVEHVLQRVFGSKTGRGYDLDEWRMLELCMFVIMITLMLELHLDFFGPGNTVESINPVFVNSCLHVLMMVSIWVRFLGVLITFKNLGPFLRMIYAMIAEVVNFAIIFVCLIVCCAAIFTSLFNNSGTKFVNFSTSMRTLYSASLAAFDMEAFTQHDALGVILLGLFLLFANVLLLNLLIAIIANVYSELNVKADSEHRAVLVSYYDRYKWDENYGVLIFLPTPFTILTFLVCPILLLSKTSAQWNSLLCKAFYILFALPQFFVLLIGSLLYLLPLYIKGLAIYGNRGRRVKSKTEDKIFELKKASSSLESTHVPINDTVLVGFNVWKSVAWIFIGLPWLLFALVRDTYDFWRLIYKSPDPLTEEIEKLSPQQIVTSPFIEDVQKAIQEIVQEEIPVYSFFEIWQKYDSARFPGKNLTERRRLANEYFHQFANSNNDPIISIPRMKRILPVKEGGLYTSEYLTIAQHVNVPWIAKAVKNYQRKAGSKALVSTRKVESSKVLYPSEIKRLQNYVSDLCEKYEGIYKDSKRVLKDMQEQTNSLRNKYQSLVS